MLFVYQTVCARYRMVRLLRPLSVLGESQLRDRAKVLFREDLRYDSEINPVRQFAALLLNLKFDLASS